MKIVTSALPYVNNIPHLGNLITVISADTYQKYLKTTGQDCISILGTDAHGTTTETVALKENLTPEQVVNKYNEKHKQIYDWFQCDFDCYGMTSDTENHEVTKQIFEKVYKNGYIEEKELEQFFDKKAQKFLADRFIEGTCPHCEAEDARGDQCDNCQKLLEPTDLINPISKLTNTKPTLKKTKHLYLKLNDLQSELENIDKTNWDFTAKGVTKGWLKEGLKPRAITRDLNWGIKVPLKGYENKVFYVWFDAPIGYISITKKSRTDWKKIWSKDNKLIQFMGKDNVPFHTIMFPATLLATKDNWPIVDKVSTNHYLNFEGDKFSKSKNIGIFGDDAIKSGIPSDAWRFYLMQVRPQTADSNFTFEDFQAKVNQNLIGNFVNLVSRVTNIIAKNKITLNTNAVGFDESKIKKVHAYFENAQIKEAISSIMELSADANSYMQEKEPWKLIESNENEGKNVLSTLLKKIVQIAALLYPVTPNLSKKIMTELNIKDFNKGIHNINYENMQASSKLSLMKKITDESINDLKSKTSKEKEIKKEDENTEIALRVGKIIEVKQHENADKLYIEKVSFGEKEIQIVSGLKNYYQIDELLNKKIIVVENLKPAKLRGVKSEGMLLAVSQGENVEVLEANDFEVGDYLIGSKESKQIKIDEFFKHKLEFIDKKLLLDKKEITSKGLNTSNGANGLVK